MNKIIIVILGVLILLLGGYIVYDRLIDNKEEPKIVTKTDSEKFALEYNIDKDNMFKYIKESDMLDFIENGSGILFFGFPECPWCQKAVPILFDQAKKKNVNTIYYFNPMKIRENNTEAYQKIISVLGEYFYLGSDGNPRLMVPDVFFIKKGEVIGHENDTSDFSEGTPDEYYTKEKIDALIDRYNKLIDKLYENGCDCN